MNDLLSNLVNRHLGKGSSILPRPRSLFERDGMVSNVSFELNLNDPKAKGEVTTGVNPPEDFTTTPTVKPRLQHTELNLTAQAPILKQTPETSLGKEHIAPKTFFGSPQIQTDSSQEDNVRNLNIPKISALESNFFEKTHPQTFVDNQASPPLKTDMHASRLTPIINQTIAPNQEQQKSTSQLVEKSENSIQPLSVLLTQIEKTRGEQKKYDKGLNHTESNIVSNPTIKIQIGRIEIKAIQANPIGQKSKKPESKTPSMSLEQFLKRGDSK